MRIHWLLPAVLLPSATLAQPGQDNNGAAPGSGLRGSSQPAHLPRAEDGGFIAAAEWDADSDGLGLGVGSACSPYSGDDDNMCNLCTSQHGGIGDCFWCSEDNSCHDKGSIFYPSSCHADGCVQDGSLTDCTGTCAAGVVAGFDVPLAQCMMGIANATYYVGKDLDQAFEVIGIDSTQFQVMSDTTLDTQGVVIAHPKANAITVSFRGTVLTAANAKLDIDCTLQDYQTKVTSTQSSVTSGWEVANGFATAYLSLRSQMENSIAWALTQVGSAPKVYITGHSLGGAMATVMASEYLLGDTPGKFGEVQVLTIAAPRSGNPTYANGIDKMTAGKWWSIQNFYDQIPHLPPQLTGFQHVSNIIIVGPNDGNIVEVTPPMDDEHYNITANPVAFHRTSSYMAQLNALEGAATGPTSCPTSVLQ